jgi:hypothetical protein
VFSKSMCLSPILQVASVLWSGFRWAATSPDSCLIGSLVLLAAPLYGGGCPKSWMPHLLVVEVRFLWYYRFFSRIFGMCILVVVGC